MNDATVEKLGELLNENPNGLLLFRDELAGLLRTMEREGHENDRAFYCEAWDGHRRVHLRPDRARHAPHPGRLRLDPRRHPARPARRLPARGLRAGRNDDGLIQRLQLAVYPDVGRAWRNVDRWPDSDAKTRAFRVFEALSTLDAADVGAHPPDPEDLPYLRFTPEAQDLFDDWRMGLENLLRAEEEHPAVVSHLSKYRSLMPSLALLVHLVDCVDRGVAGPCRPRRPRCAVEWCDYLEAHARRIYAAVTNRGARRDDRPRHGSSRPGTSAEVFTARDVYRKCWAGLSDKEDVLPALDMLEGLGWVRAGPVAAGERGGRPTTGYRINPRVPRRRG